MYYLIPTTDTVKGVKFPFHSKGDRTFQRLPQAYLSIPLQPTCSSSMIPCHPPKWSLHPFPLNLGRFITLQLIEGGGSDIIWPLRQSHGCDAAFTLLTRTLALGTLSCQVVTLIALKLPTGCEKSRLHGKATYIGVQISSPSLSVIPTRHQTHNWWVFRWF